MLTKREIEKHRQQLLTQRQRLADRVGSLRDEMLAKELPDFEGAESDGQADVGARAGQALEHETNVSLVGNEEQLQQEIEAALNRIEDGTFGRCGACQRPIARVRLNLVPYARQCMGCARERQVMI